MVLSNQRIINAPDGWTSFYGDGIKNHIRKYCCRNF